MDGYRCACRSRFVQSAWGRHACPEPHNQFGDSVIFRCRAWPPCEIIVLMTKDSPDASTRPNKVPESVRLMLEEGARTVLSGEAVDPLKGMTLQEIARRAGFSRTTAYNRFLSKADFLAALTRFLVGDPDLFAKDDEFITATSRGVADHPTVEALMSVAHADLSTLTDNEVWAAMEMLIVGYVRGKPELHEVARSGYTEVDTLTYGWYAPVLERAGRKPREPFTLPMVGSILQALAEGAGIRHMFQPDLFSRALSSASDNGAYAYTVSALLSVLTAPEADERSVMEVLEALLSE